jgi:hypothetical protein
VSEMTPNENKISDRYRKRAQIEVGSVWLGGNSTISRCEWLANQRRR